MLYFNRSDGHESLMPFTLLEKMFRDIVAAQRIQSPGNIESLRTRNVQMLKRFCHFSTFLLV